ncbi:acyltransferase [Pelagibacteraceae bacterium]|nr:acyltransferase [Pelagibacteraceae bacterium]
MEHSKYRIELDVLRALAIILVICYHLEVQFLNFVIFRGGFLGVDIFFVISGYLISSIIKTEISNNQFNLINFIERRLRRIIPVFLLAILISLPLGYFFIMPSEMMDLAKSAISSSFLLSNYYFHFSLSAYANLSSFLKPLIHTWSLSVEGQFYLTYCLIILFINKFLKKKLKIIFIIILIISFIIAIWASYSHPGINFYSSPSRFWEFILGALIPYYKIKSDINDKIRQSIVYFLLLIIIISSFYIDIEDKHPGFITISVILPTMLLIILSKNNYKIFESKFLAFIGKISFSIYIWHYLFFSFARHINFFESFFQKILILSICICFSIFSYFFYEKKLRDKKIISTKNFYKILSINFILIIIGASVIIFNNGFNKRLPEIKNYNFDNIKLRNEWLDYEKLSEREFQEDNKINVLIIGNSHGQDLYNSFSQNLKEIPNYNFAIIDISNFRCFLENKEIKDCFKNIKNKSFFNTFLKSNIIIFHNRWTKEYINMIKNLDTLSKKNNKKLVVALNRQQFNYNISNSLTTLDKNLFENSINKSVKNFDHIFDKSEIDYYKIRDLKIDSTNNELKRLTKQHKILAFDFSKFQCYNQSNRCKTITPDNEKIYWDYGHFTLKGAKYFGKLLLNDKDFLTILSFK